MIDSVSTALNERFNNDNQKFMRGFKKFVTGRTFDSETVVAEIVTVYEEEFHNSMDADRLILYRNMALDIMKNKNLNLTLKHINNTVHFFRKAEDLSLLDIVLEIRFFNKIYPTITVSTSMCEKSFFVLRRLNTYL